MSTGRIRSIGTLTAEVGDLMPQVALASTSGRTVDLLREARDHRLVLFFYPGDREGLRFAELTGCTPEACSFRDHAAELEALAVRVFGISTGTTERQRAFAEREGLTFELLSDQGHELIDALGVPLWRANTGEEFVARTTFVIERGGRISRIFENVEVSGHLDAVLRAVRQSSPHDAQL